MSMWWTIVVVAVLSGAVIVGMRYSRNRSMENRHTLNAIARQRELMGVDAIPDLRERRNQQVMRGARRAAPMPAVDIDRTDEYPLPPVWSDGDSYGPPDADPTVRLTDEVIELDPENRPRR